MPQITSRQIRTAIANRKPQEVYHLALKYAETRPKIFSEATLDWMHSARLINQIPGRDQGNNALRWYVFTFNSRASEKAGLGPRSFASQ